MKFKSYARIWLDRAGKNWSSKRQLDISRAFEKHVFCKIGELEIQEISPSIIKKLILEIEDSVPSTAKRLLRLIIKIYDFAIIDDHTQHNPARPVVAVLNKTNEKPFVFLSTRDKLSKFYASISKLSGASAGSRVAFWLIQYTATRRQEAVCAKWSEFDLEKSIWVIPANRKKEHRELIVPLSETVVKMLKSWKRVSRKTRSKWVFPCEKRKLDRPINLVGPLYLIRLAGFKNKMTIHGARKVFSTIAHESNLWSIDAIELQLSHAIPGVRGVYNKAKYLDERVKMMNWFSDEIDKMRELK